MDEFLQEKLFSEIDLNDGFFDSLKGDYTDFISWFGKKQKNGEKAIVNYDNDRLTGFLYLKDEGSVVSDTFPEIKGNKILKIGTFKIDAHGTRLGEQFLKITLDYAFRNNFDKCYVTIFKKHNHLINLFEKYGFRFYGTKNEEESVFLKIFDNVLKKSCENYPKLQVLNNNKYLISIYPKYHTRMFPDSQLKTEKGFIREDLSYMNSIHKIYVCSMDLDGLSPNDILLIYRTKEDKAQSAAFNSVITSICTVEEIHNQIDFPDFEHFYSYASSYSVFERDDLKKWYDKGRCKAIKMLYNIALPKRITKNDLLNTIGLPDLPYWGFGKISDEHFNKILLTSGVNSNYII